MRGGRWPVNECVRLGKTSVTAGRGKPHTHAHEREAMVRMMRRRTKQESVEINCRWPEPAGAQSDRALSDAASPNASRDLWLRGHHVGIQDTRKHDPITATAKLGSPSLGEQGTTSTEDSSDEKLGEGRVRPRW